MPAMPYSTVCPLRLTSTNIRENFGTQYKRACITCAVIITSADAREVLDLHHQQGVLGSTIRHGARDTGGQILGKRTRSVSEAP